MPLSANDPLSPLQGYVRWPVGRGQVGLRTLVELFLAGREVAEANLSQLPSELVVWMLESGVLTPENGLVSSAYRLIKHCGLYLLLDPIVLTPGGKAIVPGVYLSGSSFQLMSLLSTMKQPLGSCIDLGCGTGLICVLLATMGNNVAGIDIDPAAIRLSGLNLELNGVRGRLDVGDYFLLASSAKYDMVVVNPRWRIVPHGVQYLNPTARVGQGRYGLDAVFGAIDILPQLLTAGGLALMVCEIPVINTPDAALQLFIDRCPTTLEVRVEPTTETSVEAQSRISADACAHLNPGDPDLAARFRSHYDSLGVKALQGVVVRARLRP